MNRPVTAPLQVRLDSGPAQVISTASTLGRTPENTVTVNHPLVSRTHLSIDQGPGGWTVTDRGSTNGIFVDGRRVASAPVFGHTVIRLGDARQGPVLELTPMAAPGSAQRPPGGQRPVTRPLAAEQGRGPAPFHRRGLADAPHLAALQNNASAVYRLPAGAPGGGPALADGREAFALSGVQTIGRTPDNDIVVSDVLASRRHARLTAGGQSLFLEDLGSVNGTFVNGHRIHRQALDENDVVTIGNSDLVVTGGNLVRGQARAVVGGGLQLDGIGLTVDGAKRLLNDVDLQAGPGTLTAIIGPSGAGKSTVSKIAAGLNSPTVGRVTFEGRDVNAEYEALRNRIGMVPQDDVLHARLTVRQALRYAAELRLPGDLSTADRDRVIDGVLAELSLAEHAQTRIDRLSGGQRKRASVAMELLTGPSLLILDEPTSGLDPALDRQVMQTLRALADAGRVVLVVTHSVAYLDLCDQVLLLAPGGKTAYCGAPGAKAAELGADDWAEIFERAARDPDGMWQAHRQRHPHRQAPAAPAWGPPPSVPQPEPMRQLSTVARRQLRLIFADTGYLIFLIALPVVLGLLTFVIPGDNDFGVAPKGADAIRLLVVLVLGAIFMGAALTVRDLVAERAIYERERAVGLRPGAYLAAKVLVFFMMAVLQSAVMIGITYAIRSTPEYGGVLLPPALALFVSIAVLTCVSTLVGLTISALVKSSEQTMPLLVIVVMVQLVFSGGLFAVSGPGVTQLAWLFPAYWGYATAAQAVDVPGINPLAEQVATAPGQAAKYPLWEPTLGHAVVSYGALAVIAAVVHSRLKLRKR